MKRLLCDVFVVVLISWGIGSAIEAGTLVCTVATTCPSGTVIFRMNGTANSHAELPSQSNYSQLVCCTGVTGLGNTCTGTFATALKLSGTTNAHGEQGTQSTYANSACISVPAGGTVSVGYQASNCTGFDTTLGSLSGTTNAHVGDGNAYTTKICASAALTSVVSVTITSDGIISYGALPAGASKSTIQLSDTQAVKNDGNVAEDFNIKGQNTACPWTLAATTGSDQYVHEFSTNSGTNFTALTTSYQALVSNIAADGTQNSDFRITVPTSTGCFTQQSADVTIQAVLH
jgi:hypothetical protein